MVIADRHGLPVAAHVDSASPHEVTLIEATLDKMALPYDPGVLIGDISQHYARGKVLLRIAGAAIAGAGTWFLVGLAG